MIFLHQTIPDFPLDANVGKLTESVVVHPRPIAVQRIPVRVRPVDAYDNGEVDFVFQWIHCFFSFFLFF
jgi:hypothetical protein